MAEDFQDSERILSRLAGARFDDAPRINELVEVSNESDASCFMIV